MENPELTTSTPVAKPSKAPVVLAFIAGAALMVLLYATGVMAALGKAAGRATGSSEIVSLDAERYNEMQKLRGIVAEVAAEKKKPAWQVTVQELQQSPKIKALKLDDVQSSMTLQSALMPPPPNEAPPPSLEGYKPVDFADKSNKVLNYSVMRQPAFTPGQTTPATPTVVSLGEEYANKKFFVYKLEITRKPTKGPDGKDMPATPSQTVFFGPVEEKELNDQINQVKTQVDVKKLPIEGTDKTSVPARLYANAEGKLAMVIEGNVPNAHRIVNRGPVSYYTVPAAELSKYMKEREKDQTKPMPPAEQAVIAVKKG